MTGSGTREVYIAIAGPSVDPHPIPWAGLALGAMMFAGMALLAWRRAQRQELAAASRLRRIVEAALVWSFAYVMMRAPGLIALGAGPYDMTMGFGLLISALLFLCTALPLIAAADLLFDALAPYQTLAWLLAGPLLIGAFAIGFLAATGWMGIVTASPGWRETMLVAGVLIAGLSWWSRLPRPGARTASVFD